MQTAASLDAVMCALINGIQWRLKKQVCTAEELNAYMSACEQVSRDQFYHVQRPPDVVRAGEHLEWRSPVETPFPENQTARARIFLGNRGFRAPTVIFLHALMSANDLGYQRIGAHLNRGGWNAVLMHLPFQAVIEVRQLMEFLRSKGCPELGMIGTSYGGWIGALVSFMEKEFRFVTLLQPIADIEHAIWENPAAFMIRRTLMAASIHPGISRRHAHLTSPLDGRPACEGKRVLIIGGAYDTIAPPAVLKRLAAAWPDSRFAMVDQGHFGYAAMREAIRRIEDVV
jgi:pimeloyl-ACP methyl ester carboxylesterase